MAYKLEIRLLAALDIVEAYDYYELQQVGLGQEFINELEIFYNSLLDNPFSYSYYEEPIRQRKIARFPYVVVYEVFTDTIVVYSVFMTSKDPAKKRNK